MPMEAPANLGGEPLNVPYWRLPHERVQAEGSWRLALRLGRALRPLLRMVREAAPRDAAVLLLCQAVAGGATAAGLMCLAQALTRLLQAGPMAERLREAVPALVALLVIAGLRLAAEAGAEWVQARLRPAVHRLAEQRLIEASARVGLGAFDDAAFYDQLHRARDRGVMHLEGSTESGVEALGAVLAVLAALLSLTWLHVWLLPVLLLALVPEAWAALRTLRLQYASMETTITLTRQTELVAELATQRDAAAELRAHQAEHFVLDEYGRSAQALQAHLTALGQAQARTRAWGRLWCGLGLLAAFALLGGLLLQDVLPLALAGTAVVALSTAGDALRRLMVAANELFEKALYIADYDDFLQEARRHQPAAEGLVAPPVPGKISLEGVSFAYPGTPAPPVLQDLSLQIEPGQTVALVGENGSGKTTLAKLIAGLYLPTAGVIRWDGCDTRRFTRHSLAERVVMVLQEPIRWPRSARINIRVGRHAAADPDDARLRAAARDARADEVVDRLPQRWDTVLSRLFRGGSDLSAGQWQRLAVARGLFRNAPLVIWDEPTAPLDAKAEAAVYESLQRLGGGRTVVLITHRLASVRSADCIFFLEHGRLVEQGDHEALMARNGRYAELYRLQTRLHGLDEAP